MRIYLEVGSKPSSNTLLPAFVGLDAAESAEQQPVFDMVRQPHHSLTKYTLLGKQASASTHTLVRIPTQEGAAI